MISVPLTTTILLSVVVAGAFFGVGYLYAHGIVPDPASDAYKYCYHVNLTSNSSLIPQSIRSFIVPGVYAICKVG